MCDMKCGIKFTNRKLKTFKKLRVIHENPLRSYVTLGKSTHGFGTPIIQIVPISFKNRIEYSVNYRFICTSMKSLIN